MCANLVRGQLLCSIRRMRAMRAEKVGRLRRRDVLDGRFTTPGRRTTCPFLHVVVLPYVIWEMDVLLRTAPEREI